MDENAKNKLILILAILTVIFFITSIASCSNFSMQKTARNKEIAARLDLEEKMAGIEKSKEINLQKLSIVTLELENEKQSHEAAKKALLQEQLVNNNLKLELDKISKLKEALEEDLKEALVANKTKSKK